ncbi:DUF6101 family protein [Maritalea mediterranea]|uniref:DUF6101 family protein n=1 Tax=Maritalea mediterranea TaxID=2909667 RepID=UPI001F2BD369
MKWPILSPANDNGQRASEVQTVTVRKMLSKSGVPIKIKVPVKEYYGVAVATSITEDGELFSSIELVHADEDLNYRVFEEQGNHTVVAEWQNWGKQLGLPLFIRSGNGGLVPYSQHVGGVMVGQETNRRKLGPEATRRPRFLNRRKLGLVSG